ncbi:DUF2914 domain-containing protein [bacterium]|nr:DUF2914 domain-containing protein [bacterium]
MLDIILTVKGLYDRFKQFTPIAFFFGGFTWDSVTLKRIDQLFDNLILLTYLLALGALIVLVSMVEGEKIKKPWILKYREWFPLALQFFLGGLFSAYVVFYFQSASFTKTILFVGILAALLVANEFLEKRLTNLYLQVSLYFMASFSFFIFFIPVLFKTVNLGTFLLGGFLSLLMVAGILFILSKKAGTVDREQTVKLASAVLFLYALVNVFYWQNWIPPVPLSLKSGGIYHHASKAAENDSFVLRFEEPKWYQFFKSSDDPFHYTDGDTVSCFTAIFAPSKLTEKVYHHWQKYVSKQKTWITTDRLGYDIIGYRDGGYRGITRKRNVSAGKWRVDVETEGGVLLGRIDFKIEEVEVSVPLKTIYK